MLEPLDYAELNRLTALFGSDDEAEVVAAADKVTAMLKNNGLTWFDVLSPLLERPSFVRALEEDKAWFDRWCPE